MRGKPGHSLLDFTFLPPYSSEKSAGGWVDLYLLRYDARSKKSLARTPLGKIRKPRLVPRNKNPPDKWPALPTAQAIREPLLTRIPFHSRKSPISLPKWTGSVPQGTIPEDHPMAFTTSIYVAQYTRVPALRMRPQKPLSYQLAQSPKRRLGRHSRVNRCPHRSRRSAQK
jgi:hypothetical protein